MFSTVDVSAAEAACDLSICIVSWNTCDILRDCLASLYEHTKAIRFEVIVVDNESSDGTCAMIREEFPGVRLIANDHNAGFARGCNQGMSAAKGRYYLLLNSDTWISDDALSELVQFMDGHPDAGVGGCMLRWPDGHIQPSCGWFPTVLGMLLQGLTPTALWGKVAGGRKYFAPPFIPYGQHLQERDVDWIVGACIVVRAEVAETVGMIDDEIFMFGEESEWCYRIKQAGWKVRYTPGPQVTHIGCASWTLGDAKRVRAVLASQQFFFAKYHGPLSARLYPLAVFVNACAKSLIWRVLKLLLPSKREALSEVANWHMHALRWCLHHPSGELLTAEDIDAKDPAGEGGGGKAQS